VASGTKKQWVSSEGFADVAGAEEGREVVAGVDVGREPVAGAADAGAGGGEVGARFRNAGEIGTMGAGPETGRETPGV
jgi:hypothetical protein